MTCECEHAAHFDDEPRQYTPNGNPGHRYGTRFDPRYILSVETTGGTFKVCRDCATDCYRGVTLKP